MSEPRDDKLVLALQARPRLETEVRLDEKGNALLAKPVREEVGLVHRHRQASVRCTGSVCANKAKKEEKAGRDTNRAVDQLWVGVGRKRSAPGALRANIEWLHSTCYDARYDTCLSISLQYRITVETSSFILSPTHTQIDSGSPAVLARVVSSPL